MLSPSQLNHFAEQGYLVVEDLFTQEDFQPLKEEFTQVIDQHAAQLHKTGQLDDLYIDQPFDRRLALIAAQVPEVAATLQTRAHKGPALFAFMKQAKILDRIESLLGGEILCHPSYNLHPRLPGKRTGTHQDAGYYLPDGDDTLIVACLTTLVDTTPENGCLWIAPRRHREGVLPHANGPDGLDIPLEHIPADQRRLVPTQAGSAVFFSSMLPHGSLVNQTDQIRWSMDLRYQQTGQPTGRWFTPGFIARSRANPNSECPDWRAWVTAVERVERQAADQPERGRSRWQ
ncbi:MAG: hypothetical protein GKR89_04070 [Candidatus Latescibacteria bacterium]|nr:hypothetical protein [Candidatus Latescibacterota bacterium]